jgi:hypothetical protein
MGSRQAGCDHERLAIRRATESGGNFEQEGNLRRGWIALVSHDEDDGGRQFLSLETGPLKEGDAVIVSLRKILRLDPSIAELADLPLGWRAWRRSKDSPWQRAWIAQ